MTNPTINNNRSRLNTTNRQDEPAAPPPAQGYKIKSGDTLSQIAKSLGFTQDQLLAANPQIKDPDVIKAGATLNLPETAAPATGEPGKTPTQDGFQRGGTPTERRATTATPTPVASDPDAKALLQKQMQQAHLQGIRPQEKEKPAGEPTAGEHPAETHGEGQTEGRPATGEGHAEGAGHHWYHAKTNVGKDASGNETNAAFGENGGVGEHPMHGQLAGKEFKKSAEFTRGNGVTEKRVTRSVEDHSNHASTRTTRSNATDRNNGSTTRTVSTTDQNGHNSTTQTAQQKTLAQGHTLNSHTTTEKKQQGHNTETNTRRSATATSPDGGHTVSSNTQTKTVENQHGTTTSSKVSRQKDRGTISEDMSTVHKDGKERAAEATGNGHGGKVHTEATADLISVEATSKWKGVVTKGNDPTFMEDKTGAAGEVHVLAVRGQANAAVGINLKEGKLAAGGQAGFQADLIGASGKAQLGTANSVKGQVYVKGEAHVGVNASVGGGVEIDPRKGTAKVGVGGEAFAGAQVKASTGYQNRYFGAEVEARGQAGIGVAGRAEIGFDKGTFKAKADFGACVGLGGRLTVNVNVNVGAIYQDAKGSVVSAAKSTAAAVSNAASTVSGAVSSGWKSVKSWF